MNQRRARQLSLVGRAYDRDGILAIDPRAMFSLFASAPSVIENERVGDVEIIDICGPLDQHDCGWCDSYESILARCAVACEGPARSIVLRVDSPGGDASGCFDAARKLRAMCAAAGKTLIGFAEGQAGSAAYALISAASTVFASESAVVGSIGVIERRRDYSAANAAQGVRVAFISSGARKADGNPDQPLSDAELKARQEVVDSMAGVFFALVAEHRGMDAAAVAALEANIFHGESAVSAGLVDAIENIDTVLALAGQQGLNTMAAAAPKNPFAGARSALEEIAKGEDANAVAAKRALAAMDEPPAAAAPAAEPDADDAKKPAAAAPAAAPAAVSAKTAAEGVQAFGAIADRLAAVEARYEADARTALLATRPDLNAEQVKFLQNKPLAEVNAIIALIPKAVPANPALAATVQGTRGEGQGERPAAEPMSAMEALDLQMGLVQQKPGVVATPMKLTLGVLMPITNSNTPATPAAR